MHYCKMCNLSPVYTLVCVMLIPVDPFCIFNIVIMLTDG
ncbi:hypothetical protein VIBNISFn118_450008 [Vibrio nigripulchritudo SFn118]|nr:hypothetical protein VIBNISFn118_450008 [Vibrio nigripulchritudo SFn118]